jgi:hypothetical protein
MLTGIIAAGLIGFFTVGNPPGSGDPVAQLVAGPPPRKLNNEEVELYNGVYKAMQGDRDMTIDEALEPHGVSLREFRDLERRLQMNSALVERVRRELLTHAEQSSVLVPGAAGPVETPPAP